MRRQIAAVLCSAFLGFAALSSLVVAQQKTATAPIAAPASSAVRAPGSGTAATGRQLSTIKDLMEAIIDPSADVLWGAVGTIVDKDRGIQELFPKTPEEWLNVRRATVRIIEGGNLLMMPGRAAAPVGTKSETPGVELEPAQITALIRKDRKSFDDFAMALQDLGLEALRASDAKNAVLLMDVGARMENVCESCHQTFWYPDPKTVQSGGR